jgi:predicted naringenin-chalcone synthase/2-polyprenyl-3-methyl-5-hydroxy-6-metoxy-1,4-benzoquinol methylase
MKEMRMERAVYLQAIRTVVPATKVSNQQILAFMHRHVAKTEAQKAFMTKIYESASIESRYSIIADYAQTNPANFRFFPKNELLEPFPSTGERNRLFVSEAERLSITAAQALFTDSPSETPAMGRLVPDLAPVDISHIVSVSCTGFSAPGFDLAVQKALGLKASVTRTHLGFMGCYATLPALRTAYQICQSDSRARVLVLGVELCSLHFQNKLDADNLVANALFSDGAYAMMISAQSRDSLGARYRLNGFSTTLIPDSDTRMAWDIGDTGFDMRLSSYVPAIIEANIVGIIDQICATLGKSRRQIQQWAVHPGGRAILDKVASQLQLPVTALAASYEILARYGNMSAVTMAFVLAELSAINLKDPAPTFATAFGPGLTIEAAVLTMEKPRPRTSRIRYEVRSHNLPGLFPNTRNRWRLPELMDSWQVNTRALFKTLRQFEVINSLFSAYRGILRQEIFSYMLADQSPDRVWMILDIGAGGADIPRWIVREARRRGLKVRITAIDPDKRIQKPVLAACQGYPEISLIAGSGAELSTFGQFDFIICNHVLHHLTNDQVVKLIETANRLATINLVITDLARSAWAYIGYSIFASLFLRSSLAGYDGRLSILRSFKFAELRELLDKAGLDQLQSRRQMPARLIITRPRLAAVTPAVEPETYQPARTAT